MHVPKPRALVAEHRPLFPLLLRRHRAGPALLNLIQPVPFHSLHHAPLAAAPHHFNPHLIAHTPRRKHPQRLVARQIPPPADHLLALQRHRAPIHPHLRPDPPRVRRGPRQPHRHPRCAPFLPPPPRHSVQIVHHHVQVPVPVQIPQRHPLRYPSRVEAPLPAHLLKSQIPSVPKRHLPGRQTRKHATRLKYFCVGHPPLCAHEFQTLDHVHVTRRAFLSI